MKIITPVFLLILLFLSSGLWAPAEHPSNPSTDAIRYGMAHRILPYNSEVIDVISKPIGHQTTLLSYDGLYNTQSGIVPFTASEQVSDDRVTPVLTPAVKKDERTVYNFLRDLGSLNDQKESTLTRPNALLAQPALGRLEQTEKTLEQSAKKQQYFSQATHIQVFYQGFVPTATWYVYNEYFIGNMHFVQYDNNKKTISNMHLILQVRNGKITDFKAAN